MYVRIKLHSPPFGVISKDDRLLQSWYILLSQIFVEVAFIPDPSHVYFIGLRSWAVLGPLYTFLPFFIGIVSHLGWLT